MPKIEDVTHLTFAKPDIDMVMYAALCDIAYELAKAQPHTKAGTAYRIAVKARDEYLATKRLGKKEP